jgi:secreted trypsin-like serine protease
MKRALGGLVFLAIVSACAHPASEASDPKIVGGSANTLDRFPAVVAEGIKIGNFEAWSCSGTLIAPDVVLSAGHCANAVSVQAGGRIFVGRDVKGAGQIVAVRKAIQHPDFRKVENGVLHQNDLMILMLAEPVTGAEPVPLAPIGTVDGLVGGGIETVGFGIDPTDPATIRRSVAVPVTSVCTDQADQPATGCEVGREFVAGSAGLGKDSCPGDSGGGNFAMVGGQLVLVGVTSRASSIGAPICGDGGVYVRTDVAAYQDWIRETIAANAAASTP